MSYCAALAPLSKSEIRELQGYLVPVLCTQNTVGHTLVGPRHGTAALRPAGKDGSRGADPAAEALGPIADVQFLETLKSLPAKAT